MNQQQADAIRRENEARSRAQWQKTQAEFARANQRVDAERNARRRAADERHHQETLRRIKRDGEAMRNNQSSCFDNSA